MCEDCGGICVHPFLIFKSCLMSRLRLGHYYLRHGRVVWKTKGLISQISQIRQIRQIRSFDF